jgi:hypothetical protein
MQQIRKRAQEAVSKLSPRRHMLDDFTGKMSPGTREQRKAAVSGMHPAVQGLSAWRVEVQL